MTSILTTNEQGVETTLVTTTPVIGWRAHYSGGEIRTSHSDPWGTLPSGDLILLSLIEDKQLAPGKHYRTALQAEWYGYDTAADRFYSIQQAGLTLTEVQLRWPLVAAWKSGTLVSDARMQIAFDNDSAEWAV